VVNESTYGAAPAERSKPAKGWTFATFREWREREHPRTSYQIAARVWHPENRAAIAGVTGAPNSAMKNWEPRLTGFAYSDRNVYLVEVAAELSAERVGRVLYLVDLYRRDPDYAEHRSKRVHVVMIVRGATADMIAFARRRHIRVIVRTCDADSRAMADADRVSEAQPTPPTAAHGPRC